MEKIERIFKKLNYKNIKIKLYQIQNDKSYTFLISENVPYTNWKGHKFINIKNFENKSVTKIAKEIQYKRKNKKLIIDYNAKFII